jgi:hypothetical protein
MNSFRLPRDRLTPRTVSKLPVRKTTYVPALEPRRRLSHAAGLVEITKRPSDGDHEPLSRRLPRNGAQAVKKNGRKAPERLHSSFDHRSPGAVAHVFLTKRLLPNLMRLVKRVLLKLDQHTGSWDDTDSLR